MEIDVQICDRMRDLAVGHRATLLSSYTRFDNGQIDEPDVKRDIQTLTAFIDTTGEGLPDEICAECLCWKSMDNWKCSKDPRRG